MGWTASRAVWALILVSGGLRLAWAAALEPGNDEAYHHLYAVHPDWSYLDHPPMTMLVERAGTLVFAGVTPFSMRLGFVALFAGSTWTLYRWAARLYGEWAGFHAALALNLTAYFTAAAGAFVLPDGPFLFFALLTLWALSEALICRPRRFWPWVWVGLAWAGALLSKYQAAFLPAGALLYLLTTPGARRCLRTLGPYLAVAIGLTGFLPVLAWNAGHDWASFLFQGERAIGLKFRLGGLLRTVGGQMLYLFPWIWADLVLVLVAVARAGRGRAGAERFVVCQAGVPLAFFLAISCVRQTLPHWSLIGFLPLYPALGAKWDGLMATAPRWMGRRLVVGVAVTIAVAGLIVAQARFGLIPLAQDPTMEMSGWPSVARELDARGLVDRPGTFLFTDRWFDSGQLAYTTGGRAPVLCYNSVEAHGFAYWSRPEQWVGWDGILVSVGDRSDEPAAFAEFFQRIDPVAEFPMTRHGRPFRTVRVYLCVGQTQPFPFRPDRGTK